jgi:long-chain-fatty-acid--CoA ligase ACSBG
MDDEVFIIIIIVVWIALFILIKYYYSNNTSKEPNNKITSYEVAEIEPIDTNKTILQLFKKKALEYNDLTALKVYRDNYWINISYKLYYDNCIKFATSLTKNCGIDCNVGIIGFNSPAWFYSFWGTLMSGNLPIGISNTSGPNIIEHIVNECEIKILILEDSKQLEKLKNIKNTTIELIVMYGKPTDDDIDISNKTGIQIVSFTDLLNNIDQYEIDEFAPQLTDLGKPATIIYTSGTSSMPKGAIITHPNIINSLANIIKAFNQSDLIINSLDKDHNGEQEFEQEQFISYLPLNHIIAQIMDIYLPISIGGCVWFADRNALKTSLTSTLTTVKPTIFVGAPRIWEKIAEKINYDGFFGYFVKMWTKHTVKAKLGLDKCKLMITTGAPVPTISREILKSYDLTLYDIYGLTETTGPITMSTKNQESLNSVGKILPNIKIKIERNGEILVKGKTVFEGYYQDMSATKSAIDKDGWFHTGDLGKLDENKFLYITGRIKEIIITAGGDNVAPNPIEEKIKEDMLFVNNAIVIGDKKKFLSVLLTLKDGFNKTDCEPLIKPLINKINDQSSCNTSKIQKWAILDTRFEIGKELTPTMKLRRTYVEERYKKIIDELYE